MRFRPSALALPAALTATLMLIGCAVAGDGESAPTKPAASAPAAGSDQPAAPQETLPSSHIDLREETPALSMEKAVAAAETSRTGDLRSVELMTSKGILVYRIELVTAQDEVDITVNATDGTVLDTRSERLESDDVSDPAISLSDVIDVQEAMKSAAAEIDEPIESWKLSFSDGRLVFQFDLASTDRELDIDAFTGNLLEIDD